MLVLSRKPRESVVLRHRSTKAFIAAVQVVKIAHDKIRLGFDADSEIEIMRDELLGNEPPTQRPQAA